MKIFMNLLFFSLLLSMNSSCQNNAEPSTDQATTEIPVTQQAVQPRAAAQVAPQKVAAKNTKNLVKWYTMEDALKANQKEPKKFFVDVYTDWCGWCKVMDKNTFTDPKVADYLNEHFYPVKFDAEQKEAITVNGKTYEWVNGGRRGVNTLAYALLNGRLSYPSVVYLTEKLESIRVSPGYKTPDQILPELQYAAEEAYMN